MNLPILESGVQWTRWTFNPWTGCDPVSPGCLYCYAERELSGHWGKDFSVVKRTGKPIWKKPYIASAQIDAEFPGVPVEEIPVDRRLMFTASFSDIFHKDADGWRDDFWQVVRENPKVVFQILTKRHGRILKNLPTDWGDGWKNVWLGVSVENQEQAERRFPVFAKVPAAVRFASFEPLIGSVNMQAKKLQPHLFDWVSPSRKRPLLDWAILGGESGNETGKYLYRPCRLVWLKELANDLELLGVPVFVKQLGTHLGKQLATTDRHGGDPAQFPSYLKKQQFPSWKI